MHGSAPRFLVLGCGSRTAGLTEGEVKLFELNFTVAGLPCNRVRNVLDVADHLLTRSTRLQGSRGVEKKENQEVFQEEEKATLGKESVPTTCHPSRKRWQISHRANFADGEATAVGVIDVDLLSVLE